MRHERAALLALVLVAFGLRVYHLDVQSLWYDEGVTAQVARLGVSELARWTANDIQPPLYYLIVAAWFRLLDPWAGNIAYVMRFVSVFAGTLLIPLLWALGRHLWGARAGLLTALVAAVSPLMVYYSQEARMYAWLVLLVTLAALAVVRQTPQTLIGGNTNKRSNALFVSFPICVRERRKWLMVYAAAGLAAMYTHYFAGFALLALSLYWLFIWLRRFQRRGAEARRGEKGSGPFAPFAPWRALFEFALANAVILLGYLPWIPAMVRRFQVDSSYWSGVLKVREALLDVAMNFTTAATEAMMEGEARRWLPWLALAAILWLAALVWVEREEHREHRGRTEGAEGERERESEGERERVERVGVSSSQPPIVPSSAHPVALVLLWLLLPVALILALAYRTPKFNPRYLMIAWPAWALLAGGGMAGLWRGAGSEEQGSERREKGRGRTRIWGRGLAVLTGGVLLAAQLAGLQNWFGDLNFGKSAWRDAIGYMYAHRQPDEAVLLVSGHAYPVFDVYAPPELGIERARLPEIEILDVNQVVGWQDAAAALNKLADKGGVWLFLWQDEVIDPAGVTVLLLDRYAQPEPVPDFPFIGVRHYRFSPNQRFPNIPPITQAGRDLGQGLRLVGVEEAQDGVWLYWQGLHNDLPDLIVHIRITDATGEALYEAEQRPAGYDFPTTHWQAGDIYPLWIPIPDGKKPWRVEVSVIEESQDEK